MEFTKKAIKYCIFLIASAYLWRLNLLQTTRVAKINSGRIGHLILETYFYIYYKQEYNLTEKLLLLCDKPANEFLFEKWKQIKETNNITFIETDKQPFFSRFIFTLMEFQSRYIFEFNLTQLMNPFNRKRDCIGKFTLPLNDEEKQKGDKVLKEMGIGQNDWFVCVFARDDAYLQTHIPSQDFSYHNYRDSDINTLELAIKHILQKGGFVVRLGEVVAQEMNFKHPKVIDYPFSKWRSDFMDIYLQSRAKFVLSSATSGITDVVVLFNTPYLLVNAEFYVRLDYKHSLCIPMKYSLNNRLVGLKEFFSLANATGNIMCIYRNSFYEKNHLAILRNSSEEILAATQEMLERLDGDFKQTLEDKKLEEKSLNLYQSLFQMPQSKINTISPLGQQFLRDNASWYLEDFKENTRE